MIKIYCDVCGDEIFDLNKFPQLGIIGHIRRKHVRIDTILTIKSFKNNPDICRYCIIDSVKSMDDRTIKNPHPEIKLNWDETLWNQKI